MNEPVEGLEMAEKTDQPELDGGEPEEAYRGDSHPGTPQGCTVQTKFQRRPHCGLRPPARRAEDAAPGSKNLREYVRDGVGGLTERDRATLGKFRDLAASVPATIEDMLRDEKLPAMARIRLIEIIMDRAYGKAEATVNVNGNVNGIEASEMRIEALVRSLKLEGNPYEGE